MKTITKYSQYACLACLLLAGAGCSKEENAGWEQNASGKVIITGSIEDAAVAQSRVEKDQFGSYLSGGFDEGNQIGFYSTRNNEGGTPGFSNECLTYTSDSKEGYQTFESDALGDTPSNWGTVFAYYPYNSENKGNDIDIYNEDGTVIDLLTAHSGGLSGGMIHFSFTHTFSMLFIFPGEKGFSNAIKQNAQGVKVVLKEGIANATVNNTRTDITLTPATDGTHTTFTAVANTQEYTINGGKHDPGTFFYVLLPSETEVDHIEIVDDFGKLQYVRPTASQLPKLARGTRYPLTVYMQGDEPVIWPWTFTDWGDQVTIEEERSIGIHDASQLEDWIAAYNAYYAEEEPNPEGTYGQALSLYGSYNQPEGEDGKWTFYLKADIDCSTLFADDTENHLARLLTSFQDEWDGQNHTLSNLTVSGDNAGIIGTLRGNGTITNLKLKDVTITSTTTGNATGGIVNQMEGGSITNCEVSGLRIQAPGAVGALVGTMTGGTLSGNTAGGILIGASSVSGEDQVPYVVGSVEGEGSPIVADNRSNVIFQSNNQSTTE